MWLKNPKTDQFEPTKVYANAESVKNDYNILKQNLPIQIGIDHLDDNVIESNKILKKMNLLNVGTIRDVKLEDNKIKITDAEITNPVIQKLYDEGELPYFSQVSRMNTKKCESGKADVIENYSVINRVDFVEKGACNTCKTGLTEVNASFGGVNAKAIIGDDNVADDTSNTGDQSGTDGSTDGNDPDDTKQDQMLQAIIDGQTAMTDILNQLLTLAKEDEQEDEEEDAEDQEEDTTEDTSGKASKVDKRVAKLEKEINKQKEINAKAEAFAIVEPFQKEGKIKPADLDEHIAMAMSTPEQYKKVMANAEKVIDLERHGKGGEGQEGQAELVDDDGKQINLAESRKIIRKAMGKGGE